jgi:hypothetical protein
MIIDQLGEKQNAMTTSIRFLLPVSVILVGLLSLSKQTVAATTYSSAHFAFASEQRTALGAKNANGSGYLADISRDISERIGLGLKTSALGFQGAGTETYRLGAGPALYIHISNAWDLQVAALFFREVARRTQGESLYDANGQSCFLGWQHIYPIAKEADFLLGGFLIANFQNRLQSQVALIPSRTVTNPSAGALFDRGVEIALRFRL